MDLELLRSADLVEKDFSPLHGMSNITKEPLIKSGSNRLSVIMFCFKAWSARNSRAIAKLCNAETGHFNHKMSIHDLIRGSLKFLFASFALFADGLLFFTAIKKPP